MIGTGYKSMHIFLLAGFITLRYLSVYHCVEKQQTEVSILANSRDWRPGIEGPYTGSGLFVFSCVIEWCLKLHANCSMLVGSQ